MKVTVSVFVLFYNYKTFLYETVNLFVAYISWQFCVRSGPGLNITRPTSLEGPVWLRSSANKPSKKTKRSKFVLDG